MKLKEYTIYDDYNTSPDDYADMYEQYKEDYGEEPSDDIKWQMFYDELHFWFDAERANLNKRLDTEIIAIADLGLWNGRRQGYKILGYNLNDIFSVSEDYNVWTCDRYNVRGQLIHHDGTNYVVYRAFKPGLSDTQKENFCDALYYGKCTPQMISRYTRSLTPDVSAVYGWPWQKKKGA